MTAEQFVRDGLTACFPPGAPLPGEIVRARFTGKQKAVGTMTLFDGATGAVEVSQNPRFFDSWCIAWLDVGGWAFHWTGTRWERIRPIQMTFFD